MRSRNAPARPMSHAEFQAYRRQSGGRGVPPASFVNRCVDGHGQSLEAETPSCGCRKNAAAASY